MKSFFISLLVALAVLAGLYHAPEATLSVLTVCAVIGATVYVVANISRQSRRNALFPAINTAPANWGTHAGGKITMLADAAITTRYKLVKKGTDANHIAIPTAVSDEPIGICIDEPAAAEDPVTVIMLGAHDGTVPMVAGGNITDGAALYMDADGDVVVKPTAAGTYWFVGNARGAWSAGEVVEVIPSIPEKLTIQAALTSTNGYSATSAPDALTSTNGALAAVTLAAETSTNGTAAAAAADLAALAAETEKIGDDTRDVRAKFATAITEMEKASDDIRLLHAKYTLLVAEVEKIGDDARLTAASLAAAKAGVALATT